MPASFFTDNMAAFESTSSSSETIEDVVAASYEQFFALESHLELYADEVAEVDEATVFHFKIWTVLVMRLLRVGGFFEDDRYDEASDEHCGIEKLVFRDAIRQNNIRLQ
jgi:hypothetical protein